MDKGFKVYNWLRWSYGLFLGIVFKFILDIIFSLIYTNYNLFQPLVTYLPAILIVYLAVEILLLINHRLGKIFAWESKPYHRFLIQFVIDTLIAVIIVVGVRWSVKFIFDYANYISFPDELTIISLTIFIVLIFEILQLSIFLLNKWRFSLAELEKFKKENAEYRFDLLRSQLNPHFLFNSLNTLSSLVYESQENASLFIRELSDVYRYMLENRDQDVIPLTKELDFVGSYISLVQLRFGNNLEVVLDLQHMVQKYSIAPLTLQLLIENAIKHNVVSKKNPLHIDIFIEDERLIVKNNLQPKTTKEYSSEMGLKNITSRYGFLSEKSVDIVNNGESFSVKIPLLWNEVIRK